MTPTVQDIIAGVEVLRTIPEWFSGAGGETKSDCAGWRKRRPPHPNKLCREQAEGQTFRRPVPRRAPHLHRHTFKRHTFIPILLIHVRTRGARR